MWIKPSPCHPDTFPPQKCSSLHLLRTRTESDKQTDRLLAVLSRFNCSMPILSDGALPSQVVICSAGCPLRPGQVALQNVLLILFPPPEKADL